MVFNEKEYKAIKKFISKNSKKSVKIVAISKNQDKKLVDFFLSKMVNYIDVIIPRGGKKLVRKIQTKIKMRFIFLLIHRVKIKTLTS